jgi:tetrahydromethanopterin S-methyltransferase subunit B
MPADDITLTEWARAQAPSLQVVSASTPDPVFQRHNLVAVVGDSEIARDVVRDWERIEALDAKVGTVVLGKSVDRSSPAHASSADPERVTAHAGVRVLKGGIPGAVVGAVLVGLVVVMLDGWDTVVIGAALGGAAFGFVAGAVMSFVKGSGWGAAYEQTFVDDEAAALVFTSIHSETDEHIEQARQLASNHDGVTLYRVDRSGQPTRPGLV